MPKMSIYVSDEMKARIDEAGDRANWSGIAQRAFGVELNHLESVKEIGTMTDVIERLRASKEKTAEASAEHGQTAGREWAKRSAEYDELKRVAAIDIDDIGAAIDDYSALEIVAMAITGDKAEVRTFIFDHEGLESIFGVDSDMLEMTLTAEWVEGFVQGAAAVWEEVANKI